MPLVIPAGFFNVSFQATQSGSGQKAAVTIGVSGPDPVNHVEALAFEDALVNAVVPITTADWTYNKVTWSSAAGTVREAFRTSPGQDASAALIAAAAVLVHKRTALPGRQGRGRMFFPGPGEGAVDGTGMLTVGRLADWNAAIDAFILAVQTNSDYDMVLLHNQAVGGPAPPAPTPITDLAVSPKCGIQRRRVR